MATYDEQMQRIFRLYQEQVTDAPTPLSEVFRWAQKKSLWELRPDDGYKIFAKEMQRALRNEYRTDTAGRRYRAKHAVRTTVNRKQTSLWTDIDTAPHKHIVKSVAQRRKQIVGDCYQLRIDVDHYNEANLEGKEIQLELNFTADVEERLIEDNLLELA